MGVGIVEVLRGLDDLLVSSKLAEEVNSHGGNELSVLDSSTILESNLVARNIDLSHITTLAKALLLIGESSCDSGPDTTGTVASREAESGVGAPISGDLVHDNVVGQGLEVGSRNTLTEPASLHLYVYECTVREYYYWSIFSWRALLPELHELDWKLHTLLGGTAHTLKL